MNRSRNVRIIRRIQEHPDRSWHLAMRVVVDSEKTCQGVPPDPGWVQLARLLWLLRCSQSGNTGQDLCSVAWCSCFWSLEALLALSQGTSQTSLLWARVPDCPRGILESSFHTTVCPSGEAFLLCLEAICPPIYTYSKSKTHIHAVFTRQDPACSRVWVCGQFCLCGMVFGALCEQLNTKSYYNLSSPWFPPSN